METRHSTAVIAKPAENIEELVDDIGETAKTLKIEVRKAAEIMQPLLSEEAWQELETTISKLEQDRNTVQKFCADHNISDRFLRINNDISIPFSFWHTIVKILENKAPRETLIATLHQPFEELLKTYYRFEFTLGDDIDALRCCLIIFSADLTASVKTKAPSSDKEYTTTLLTLLRGQTPYWLAKHLLKYGTPIPTDEYPNDPLLVRAHHNLLYSACYWNNHQLVQVFTNTAVYTQCPEDIKTAALLFSVCRGGYEILTALGQAGMNLTVTDNEGNNAWHWLVYDATHHTYSNLSETLLTETAYYLRIEVNVNVANRRGITPLHLGITNTRVLRTLIDAGADICAADLEGNTALHKIAQHNSYFFNLENDGHLFLSTLNHRNLSGYTPLDIALQQGNFKFALWALEQGADVSSRVNPTVEPVTLLLTGLNNFVHEHLTVVPLSNQYRQYPDMVMSATVLTLVLAIRRAASIQADDAIFNQLLSVMTSLAGHQPEYALPLKELTQDLRDAEGNTIYHYAAHHNPKALTRLTDLWEDQQEVSLIFIPNQQQQLVASNIATNPVLLLTIINSLLFFHPSRTEVALFLINALHPYVITLEQQELLALYQSIVELKKKPYPYYPYDERKRTEGISQLVATFQLTPFNEKRFLDAIKDINDVSFAKTCIHFCQQTGQSKLAEKIKALGVKDLPIEATTLPSIVRTPVTTYGIKPAVPQTATKQDRDRDRDKKCSVM